jgi:hypothetical protein
VETHCTPLESSAGAWVGTVAFRVTRPEGDSFLGRRGSLSPSALDQKSITLFRCERRKKLVQAEDDRALSGVPPT